MTRYDTRFWTLAAAMAGLAGYVDAIGFLKLGGLFVSFMSGNSTRLAVGIAGGTPVAAIAAGLVAAFVGGVFAGTLAAAAAGAWRKPVVLAITTGLLALAALVDGLAADRWTTACLAAAMGVANTVFQRDGEVSIGVTYMTGALVKCAQRLAAAVLGGARWAWLPYLMLWSGLVGGAILGASLYPRLGGAWGIGMAAAAAALLTGWAVRLGPVAVPPPPRDRE
ncbi:MAG: YoaK family protein [Sphingomonas taxi]